MIYSDLRAFTYPTITKMANRDGKVEGLGGSVG